MGKKQVPAIRFQGFTDAWEQRKLSEITDKVTEKNAGLQYVETFTNSAEFGIISQRDFFDHDIAKLGSLDGYYIVKDEDFVYNPRISTSAPVGPINRNKLGRTGVMSPLYTVFRPHDIDTTYLEHFFKCDYWHSFMNFNGDSGARSDRFSIRDNVFFQMPIPIPDIDEQRKIGELLTCLDHLITLHQRKYEKLLKVKKSMLEKMFPRDGADVPEIRFDGFTDAWEQRKLGELIENISTGRSVNSEDCSASDGEIGILKTSCVSYNEFISGENKRVIDKERDLVKCPVKKERIIVSRMNTPDRVGACGYVAENHGNLFLPDRLWQLKFRDGINSYFIYTMLISPDYKNEIHSMASGTSGSMYNISKERFLDLSIEIPSNIAEQIAIGCFFKNLSDLITLHQRKYNWYR